MSTTLNVLGVKTIKGTAEVVRHGREVTVTGEVSAQLVRECVASLEPMEEDIHVKFTLQYWSVQSLEDYPEEMEADLDAPDPLVGDTLHMDDVFIEQLVLAMQPYPRKEGAEPVKDPGANASISPFSVLKTLKSDDSS
ncbi:MAG: DUF177 domain-containing protein [Pseudomonadota bacterium]